MPRINLLPWREQQRTERKKSFAVGMIAAAIAALAVSGAGYLFMSGLIDAQGSRNTRLTEEIKVLDKKIEQINSLEQQKQQFIAHIQIIEKLQRSRPEIVHVFDTFVKTIPDGTYLTAVTQTGQRFKIQGVAQSSTRVSSFMRSLDASQWLKEAQPGSRVRYQGQCRRWPGVHDVCEPGDLAGRKAGSHAQEDRERTDHGHEFRGAQAARSARSGRWPLPVRLGVIAVFFVLVTAALVYFLGVGRAQG